MGYNLNRLKQQYGVGSASKLGYAGVRDPGTMGAFNYNKEKLNDQDKLISEDIQRANYDAMKADYDIRKANYDLNSASDRAAYDNYSAQYDQRLQGAPMYANQQFANSKRVAPNTVNEMYQKYLGRENENVNTDLTQVTDAQRNQFIRDSNTELAGLGINNTGNQYMMNQMGNYYGNYLGAPVYGGGMSATSPLTVAANIANDTVVDTVVNSGLGASDTAVIPDITLISDTSVDPYTRDTSGNLITDTDISTETLSPFEAYGTELDQLNQMYMQELGRPIQDAEALKFYGNQLQDGRAPADIIADLAYSQQGQEFITPAEQAIIDADQAAINTQSNLSTVGNAADDAAQIQAMNNLMEKNSQYRLGTLQGPGPRGINIAYDNNDQGDLMNVLYGAEEYRQGFVNDLNAGLGKLFGKGDKETEATNAAATSAAAKGTRYGLGHPGANATSAVTSNAGGMYKYGIGGSVKGYRKGGPGGDFEVEEEIIIPDTTLEGDPLDMDALVEETIAPTPAMSPNVIAMRKMLQDSQSTSQDAGIESLGQEYNTSVGAYQKAMANLASQESKGPSESEKWFRIAAAFGKPTQSGNFFDGLGNVSEALGDIQSERREAQSTGTQLLLENSRFSMDLLKDQLATATSLQTDEKNYNRNLQELFLTTENERMLLAQERGYDILSEQEKRQWELDNKKDLPQTVAGKAAYDLGYKRGDADYIKFVKDYYEREQTRKDLEIKTLSDQASKLTKPELDLAVETDKYIVGQNSAIALLEQALELNEDSYTNTTGDSIAMYLKGKTNPSDPKYVATEKLMNVLSKGALATLKATFGGNISDGERAANLDLQGLNSMSLKARREIIDQALQMMIRERDRNKAKLVKIRDGSYATRDKKVETK